VLGLESAEKSLLSTENLDGRTGRLGKVHERASVGDEARTDQFTNKRCKVGRKCLHACGEVSAQVLTMLGKVNDLLGECGRGLQILVGDLSTHTDLSSRLDSRLDLLGQNAGEVCLSRVCSEAHLQHDLGVCEVVVEDLGKLWEVPSVPFLDSHCVCVELLVEDIETGNALDDHGVHLIR
jgi:hypothetical protein